MRALSAIVAVLALLLAGCSSAGPTAQEWAAQVCGALVPWRATITDLNRRAAEQMAKATTTEQTRANLMALVADARDATETARAAVAGLHVPDVPGGSAVAAGFAASLTEIRDAYSAAEAELRSLPGGDETTFYDGVIEVLDRLNQRYQQGAPDLTELESTPLREAFDQVPECR